MGGKLSGKEAAAGDDSSSFKMGLRKSVTWHEQFTQDFQADLEDAQLQKLSSKAVAAGSGMTASPMMQAAIESSASALLEGVAANRKRKKDEKSQSEHTTCCSTGSSSSASAFSAAAGGAGSGNSGTGAPGAAGGAKPKAPPGSMLRKGDSGNLRAMLLNRRNSNSGKTQKDLQAMLAMLEGGGDDEGAPPDEIVQCLQLHTAMCRMQHKTNEEDQTLNKEISKLQELLNSSQTQAMHSLITIAVQWHNLLCTPLDSMAALCQQVTLAVSPEQSLSPLHLIGRFTELARELNQASSPHYTVHTPHHTSPHHTASHSTSSPPICGICDGRCSHRALSGALGHPDEEKHNWRRESSGDSSSAVHYAQHDKKIHSADRRTGMQACSMQHAYDVTIVATLKAQEGEDARKTRMQNHTMEGGGAAAVRWSPADGSDGLEVSHRAQLWEVAIRRAEPRMAPGTSGSDGRGTGTQRRTVEGGDTAAAEWPPAAGSEGLGLSHRPHQWVMAMG
jgi:hypothetical protein